MHYGRHLFISERGNIVKALGMITIIFLTILLFLWILWTASEYMVNKVLFISPSLGYIDDQHTLIQNEIHTGQEEMVVFDIESQFRRQ